ncbi:hypothetical protein V6N13_110849 [Hibiscus sabdariffa]
MLTKSDKFAWGYYCGPYEPPGESKGSGSSGQIDNEIVASEDSSAPTRKCIALNLDKVRWKNIEKKILVTVVQLVQSKAHVENMTTSKTMPHAKRRKTTSVTQELLLDLRREWKI